MKNVFQHSSEKTLAKEEAMKTRIMAFLVLTTCVFESMWLLAPSSSAHPGTPTDDGRPPLDHIQVISAGSKCASYYWKERGHAPQAYTTGLALVFARGVCQSSRADVKIVSAGRISPGRDADQTDALNWYDSVFRGLNLSNDKDGVDTLRHAYTLLLGLGMQESSGKYCAGRDRSANFDSADSAEAGAFQTSWGASKTNATLPKLFDRYSRDRSGCLLDVFSKGVSCSAWDARTWGEGTGADWQKLTKACPAFAAEYAAVLLRTSGGSKGEFGPLRHKKAEVRLECDSMLVEVQTFVESHPEVCSSL
jgi:hypothetical protein